MFDFHKDKIRYFNIQKEVTQVNIIPFIQPFRNTNTPQYVLEIGCAEAGVLKAFLLDGDDAVGVELSPSRYQTASKFLEADIAKGKATIINQNIYDIDDPIATFGRPFDVIILKDVIEHIPDQERFIPTLKKFIADDGVIFFAYPPWRMPFGGHQQICNNKLLRTLPWFHLLPKNLYKAVLNAFGEKEATVNELLEVKSTGINIERLYKILQQNKFTVTGEIFWLINPIYCYKFGLKSRVLYAFLSKIPWFRNFYTTAHYIAFKK